jgi:diguanylate cyclase (GGDEF)-like protein
VGDDGCDQILCELCHILRGFVGAEDLIARCGGEEFALVLSATTLEEGMSVAEKVRQAIAGHLFPLHEKDCHLTVSIGVSSPRSGGCSPADLLHRARLAVQRAKDRGKNRVVAADETVPWEAVAGRV